MRDQGIGPNQAPFPDHGAVQNGCAHAHQNFIGDGAGMQDRSVPDGHEVAYQTWNLIGNVQHRVVLDVRVMPDDDAVDVTAENSIIPGA